MPTRKRTGVFGYRDILLAFRRIGLEGELCTESLAELPDDAEGSLSLVIIGGRI